MEARFKEGDKVRIKSLDWYKEQDGLIPSWLCPCCGRVMTITVAYIQGYAVEEVQGVLFKDFMIEGLVEEEEALKQYEVPTGSIKIWDLPNGYIFKDENGNVINATKIVLEKKKKEYPKTYKECCKVLGIEGNSLLMSTKYITDYERDLWNLMGQLHGLIICRDAYWKIAGEEMELGKPWSPYDSGVCYGIFSWAGEILHDTTAKWCVLTFPTEEMRDAFYENFKELIQRCKELL